MKLCLILLSAALLHTQAKVRDTHITMCSETEEEEEEDTIGLEGEEKWYADFTQGRGVMTLPEFADPFGYVDGSYARAVSDQKFCKQNLEACINGCNRPAEAKDAPQTSVYTKHRVQLGSRNTLICYITGFYPPHVSVSWTRNDVNVTDESSLSRYYMSDDRTYKLTSHLSFTPEQGDIYTCTVEHTALSRPLTKTWDVQVALPGVGPSVFCGVGLAAGLLGVAVGTFFLVKGNNCS